jgi:hypothetical protein
MKIHKLNCDGGTKQGELLQFIIKEKVLFLSISSALNNLYLTMAHKSSTIDLIAHLFSIDS